MRGLGEVIRGGLWIAIQCLLDLGVSGLAVERGGCIARSLLLPRIGARHQRLIVRARLAGALGGAAVYRIGGARRRLVVSIGAGGRIGGLFEEAVVGVVVPEARLAAVGGHEGCGSR